MVRDYRFKTKPYEHQLVALEKSWDKEEYAYFMEMGTGKSKVLIDNIAILYDKGKINAALIIAQKGVYRNWLSSEIPTHMPSHIQYKSVLWTASDVRLDRLRVSTAANDWALLAPSHIRRDSSGWRVDSLVLVGREAARLSLRGAFPDRAEVAARLEGADLPLGDLGELLQSASPMRGGLTLTAAMSGTRAAPRMALDVALRDAEIAGVSLERATATGRYEARVLDASLRTLRGDVTALQVDASLPVDLALHAVPRRLLEDAPLRARLRSDSVGVAMFETLTKEITLARGTLALDVSVFTLSPKGTKGCICSPSFFRLHNVSLG